MLISIDPAATRGRTAIVLLDSFSVIKSFPIRMRSNWEIDVYTVFNDILNKVSHPCPVLVELNNGGRWVKFGVEILLKSLNFHTSYYGITRLKVDKKSVNNIVLQQHPSIKVSGRSQDEIDAIVNGLLFLQSTSEIFRKNNADNEALATLSYKLEKL